MLIRNFTKILQKYYKNKKIVTNLGVMIISDIVGFIRGSRKCKLRNREGEVENRRLKTCKLGEELRIYDLKSF